MTALTMYNKNRTTTDIYEYEKTTEFAPELAAKNRRLALALGLLSFSVYVGYILMWCL